MPLQAVVTEALFSGEYGEEQLQQLGALLKIVADLGVAVAQLLTRETLPGAKPSVEETVSATMSLLEKCQREVPEREAHVLERQQQAARRSVEACKAVSETIKAMEASTAATGVAMRSSAAASLNSSSWSMDSRLRRRLPRRAATCWCIEDILGAY
jgi:hypothetical protein